jgi:GNAT superfamily N-acetyltransferase
MQNQPIQKNNFFISTDASKINIEAVHHYLCNESYWAKNIPLNIVQKSIQGSLCFGVYKKENETAFTQVGFARIITDKATFAYLADVFIIEKYRGMGLSKWLMQEIMGHEELQGLRGWMLGTKDAHGLYEQFGFKRLENSERIMRLSAFEAYPEISD